MSSGCDYYVAYNNFCPAADDIQRFCLPGIGPAAFADCCGDRCVYLFYIQEEDPAGILIPDSGCQQSARLF